MTTDKDKWVVVAEPVGANPQVRPDAAKGGRKRATAKADDKDKDNVGGVVVYVALGRRKEEVTRVGYIRENSENPDVEFDKKLDEVVQVAQKTCDTLNELTPDGPLQ